LYKKQRGRREYEQRTEFNLAAWQPKTKLGTLVKEGKITSIEQIFTEGKSIKETEIIEALLPNLAHMILETASVQRMTKDTRKRKYRTTAIVGDRNGHIGLGVGKVIEVRPSIDEAIKNAKKNVISVSLGCGSWECNCKTNHSVPITLHAKCGTAEITLKPAPRGVGIVAGPTAKSVLEFAGIKDVWTFSRGRREDIYNMAMVTYLALQSLSEIKNAEAIRNQ